MNNKPFISIIIPTRNSSRHLTTLLKSIKKQKFLKTEVIIADNNSTDDTSIIARKYNAAFIKCNGKAPQVARQRNLGAKKSEGEYVYFMDHDMELTSEFLELGQKKINKNKNIDAWYVPEKIISNSKILSIVRNFEANYIDGTVVCAARIIKRSKFFEVGGYDENLSGGPSDWDLNNRLVIDGIKIKNIGKFIYHHEEDLTLFKYIFKKTTYITAGEKYKAKWRKNKYVYNKIVKKQYSAYYRLLKIFIENGKFKKLIKQLDKYILFLAVKSVLSANYLLNLYYKKYAK